MHDQDVPGGTHYNELLITRRFGPCSLAMVDHGNVASEHVPWALVGVDDDKKAYLLTPLGTPDEIRDNPQVIEAYLGKKEG